jgi:hypothetical protein
MSKFLSSLNNKLLLAFAAILVVAVVLRILGIWPQGKAAGEDAYVGERTLTVFSRLSQVREPVATLRYGERVAVVDRRKDQIQVRTDSGVVGWTEQRYLMDAPLWRSAGELRRRARDLPVQARAHTRVPTNVRVDAGRSAARIFQFPGSVPLEILERAVVAVSQGGEEQGSTGAGNASSAPASADQEVKKEDWVLVRGKMEDAGEVSGWVLRRFIEFDTPAEIAEYAANFRFVAWFELSRVADGDKMRPQYLAMGAQGGDGQPCDFTLMRVYTWGAARRRYETAYVESFLCGRFPVRVQPAGATSSDAGFTFTNVGKHGEEQREYEMHLTSVRRVDLEKRRRSAARPPGR